MSAVGSFLGNLFGVGGAPPPPPPPAAPPAPPTMASTAVSQAASQQAAGLAAASGQGFGDTVKTSSLGAPNPNTGKAVLGA